MTRWKVSEKRMKDVRTKVFQHSFFPRLTTQRWWVSYVRNVKKNRGSPTSFWREHVRKNTLKCEKDRASLANKATVFASPKILQLVLGKWIISVSANRRAYIWVGSFKRGIWFFRSLFYGNGAFSTQMHARLTVCHKRLLASLCPLL